MIQAYAVADVRAVEAALMERLPEGELMARAANGLAEVVRARLAERGGHRVVALVGGGNNGGGAPSSRLLFTTPRRPEPNTLPSPCLSLEQKK